MREVNIQPSTNMVFCPAVWNRPGIVSYANCYSYALDVPFLGAKNLGSLASQEKPDWLKRRSLIFPKSAFNRAVADGLRPVENTAFDPAQQHILAVFLGVLSWRYNLLDFHFFRLDGDGQWSHKPGMSKIKKVIIPPQNNIQKDLKSAYGQYVRKSSFVGFFEVPKTGIPALPNPRQPHIANIIKAA